MKQPLSRSHGRQEAGDEVVHMTAHTGRRYSCYLPAEPPDEEPSSAGSADGGGDSALLPDNASPDNGTRNSPEELLDAMRDICFLRVRRWCWPAARAISARLGVIAGPSVRLLWQGLLIRRCDAHSRVAHGGWAVGQEEGWWTYELCYKKHLRQYHAENGQDFMLGLYDDTLTAALHHQTPDTFLQKDLSLHSAAQRRNLRMRCSWRSRYHAHVFVNGTQCDLTSKLRSTEVRFFCEEAANPLFAHYVAAIKEAPTCCYTLDFHTSLLCKHRLYGKQVQPVNTIHCYLLEAPNSEPPASEDRDSAEDGSAESEFTPGTDFELGGVVEPQSATEEEGGPPQSLGSEPMEVVEGQVAAGGDHGL
eukprot:SM002040S06539  [mRNA]  locus=s2040:188:1717:+ [translate_table: standard]